MNKNAAISARILANVANGMSLPEVYDAVFGAGSYLTMAGTMYDALSAKAADLMVSRSESNSYQTKQAQRQDASRQAREQAGGKQIAVMLTPKAAEKLAKFQGNGESIAQVVNKLLERSRP